ncbi:NAD(P) transhydrogenase subunit alpha [Kitasatospora aburaviensis]|uniref:proton-translocating NAD(P)(+) transhydrogenase n=1 Tax=Kitasatospora aburaviensis TaxID=67265 RepID=A0ABW1F7L5_9ACTN
MAAVTLGVLRERHPGETRVALVPEGVRDVCVLGLSVLVEGGAGAVAGFTGAVYRAAGARVVSRAKVTSADIVVVVRRPTVGTLGPMRRGQILLGLLRPMHAPFVVRRWADEGATLISLDQLAATAGPASSLDAAAGQAEFAGSEAVRLAADRLGREPAGRPTGVLVLGGGPATRRAIETARLLGADVQVHGASERAPAAALPSFDIVISTVEPSDSAPPLLLDDDALRRLRPGSVVVDLACGPYGRTVAGAEPGVERVLADGVTVVGAGDLAARVPASASAAFSRSVTELLAHLVHDGRPVADLAEPALAVAVIAHAGAVRHAGVLRGLAATTAVAGLP